MPQKRKASTIASAKIAEDAATKGGSSRKRKSDASLKDSSTNGNGNTHEQEHQHTPNNDEIVIEESSSNNIDNISDSDAPPDKRRKKDEEIESHQNNGNINGHTPIDAADATDATDTAAIDLKRDDMSFVLASQQSQDQMSIDDFIKQPENESEHVSSAPNETEPSIDDHVTNGAHGQESSDNNLSFDNEHHSQENKRELDNRMSKNVFEKGHIVFLYRPKIGVEHPESVDDVQRLYIILIPHFVRPSLEDEPIPSLAHLISHDKQVEEGKPKLGKPRSIIIGKKQLPEITKHERFWAFVDEPFDNLNDIKEFVRGQEYTPGQNLSCRLLGRGVYNIVEHREQSHLVYVLEFPEEPTKIHEGFKIVKEGSYVISVKNPEIKNPPQIGLPDYEQVKFPSHLEEQFRGRRFMPLTSTEFLDYKGCEFLLIGASDDIVGELGEEVGKELEDLAELEIKSVEPFAEKEIFDELRLEKGIIPTEPAFHGMWK
ncbi:16187_t:CDS:2 [Acaulospora colombiana]|uniref:16187_t:CDS:1 n=1 Tax=Acaulospora colombiana TaxID=27376 RepID=A0ACA9LFU6_9GLOM|nr:16187_t:CDS:2 [Acaulospora colombiana]